ncbi:MAG: SRPBCC family protein [Alphaproteobacteria bacterium]|nr:SRPBCC family protein [Alphaproteobacteria bacterium]
MPKFETRHPVGHSAEDMFRLVADVERYPGFVPLCTALDVTSRTMTPHGEELVATMGVGSSAFTDTFTTRVLLNESQGEILVSYLDGPFDHLENRWRFMDRDDGGSTIDFYISYAFRSPLLGLVLGPVFEKAFRRFAVAFETRADQIYGKPTAALKADA